jgi:NAD(P)-dependent dehydrogenase (short-subunit alcohol dehydrogenase family)
LIQTVDKTPILCSDGFRCQVAVVADQENGKVRGLGNVWGLVRFSARRRILPGNRRPKTWTCPLRPQSLGTGPFFGEKTHFAGQPPSENMDLSPSPLQLPRKKSMSLEMFQLSGKVAVVIGGARHLGYDMAEILAEAGCDLAITSRTEANAAAAAEKLRGQFHREVISHAVDVRDFAQVEAFAQKAFAWKGHVDVLINNAGGNMTRSPAHLFQRPPQDIAELITTNLTGVLFCCKAFGKLMADQGHGKIINIASIAGLVGRDRRMYERNGMLGQPIDYAAAKAGVIGMTRDLAGLLSPMGVYVNAISPGGFGPRELPPGFVTDYSDRTPLGRMGRDGVDLKGAALFLASPASDYVTGHNLVVDGGFCLWH